MLDCHNNYYNQDISTNSFEFEFANNNGNHFQNILGRGGSSSYNPFHIDKSRDLYGEEYDCSNTYLEFQEWPEHTQLLVKCKRATKESQKLVKPLTTVVDAELVEC